jgi:hypothetical protein
MTTLPPLRVSDRFIVPANARLVRLNVPTVE